MCIKVELNGKTIKLKKLQNFNHHIHKRFYCDEDVNIWYKPKGKSPTLVPYYDLEKYAEEYPASLPLIFQLKDFNRFVKNKSKVHPCDKFEDLPFISHEKNIETSETSETSEVSNFS